MTNAQRRRTSNDSRGQARQEGHQELDPRREGQDHTVPLPKLQRAGEEIGHGGNLGLELQQATGWAASGSW